MGTEWRMLCTGVLRENNMLSTFSTSTSHHINHHNIRMGTHLTTASTLGPDATPGRYNTEMDKVPSWATPHQHLHIHNIYNRETRTINGDVVDSSRPLFNFDLPPLQTMRFSDAPTPGTRFDVDSPDLPVSPCLPPRDANPADRPLAVAGVYGETSNAAQQPLFTSINTIQQYLSDDDVADDPPFEWSLDAPLAEWQGCPAQRYQGLPKAVCPN
jgi:hypothetical protein